MITHAQIELLVDSLFDAAEAGTPVREMRILIDAGPAAAGPIARQLAADLADDDEPDELTGWLFLCLVLGELGNPIAAPVLADAVLRDREVSALAVVASEALGRIGASAMPEIRRVAASANQQHRLLAYFAAGRTRSADGNAFLLSALTADPTLADISALALADSGDPAAIGPIYQALERCEPWQRPDLEAALRDLNAGVRDDKEYDWRVRLRMDQMGSRFPLNWAVVSSIIRSDEGGRDPRGSAPVRPLEQILAEPPDEQDPDLCESCGTARWTSAGVPVCSETAAAMAAIQARGLLGFAEDPDEDLALVLDDLEDAYEDQRKDTRRKRRRGRAVRTREQADDEADDEALHIRIVHAGGVWATQRGADTVGEACLLLVEEAQRAARDYGDPDGATPIIEKLHAELTGGFYEYKGSVGRSSGAHDPFVGVGRNDECPCGSGRKFKKCHGAGPRLEA